jgi:type II secretory ATPase GspE/PulE/Tfp pilus assembly ATPase PilB-like protein
LTGHLCLGSIHTNSATETILRLSEQGIPPTIMANTLKMLVSQRLIASVCKHCSISASRFKAFEAKKIPMPQKPRISSRNKADRAILEKFEADRLEYIRLQAMSNNYFQEAKVVLFNSFKNDLDSVRMRNSLGCEHCSQGRDGRILVAEVVKVDDNGKKFILELDTPSWNKYLNEQGFKSICERARRKITAGLIDPFDTNQIIDGVFEENTFTFNYSDLEALLTNKKRIA